MNSSVNKKQKIDPRITLSAKHTELINDIKSRNNSLNELCSKLSTLKSNKETIMASICVSNTLSQKLKLEKEMYSIDTEIDNIINSISDIENSKELHDFQLKSMDYLKQYNNDTEQSKGRILIEYLSEFDTTFQNYKQFYNNSVKTQTNSINSLFNKPYTVTDTVDKCDAVSTVSTATNKSISTLGGRDWCAQCDLEKTLLYNEGVVVCVNCGAADKVITETHKSTYKENSQQDNNTISYKKMNHFNEWLHQCQGKETTNIPYRVYDILLKEIEKDKLKEHDLTNERVRHYLSEHKENKYYEHIPYIISKLKGEDQNTFSIETEEKLRNMFKEILTPFKKYKNPKRNNLLSYSYIFHQLMYLIGEEEHLKMFPLLKSDTKLLVIDELWEKICKDLGWKFRPTSH